MKETYILILKRTQFHYFSKESRPNENLEVDEMRKISGLHRKGRLIVPKGLTVRKV